VIYLLRCEQDTDLLRAGWIKIGTTTRLSVRLKQIAFEIGHTPTVLAVLDGGFAEEHALHVRFHYAKARGEWFHAGPELMQLIATDGRPWDGIDERTTAMTRFDMQSLRLARKAATLMGMSVFDYVNDVLARAADEDIEREAKKLAERSNQP
jgi:hypothetical protein